jgi:hypothetical protein
MHTLLTTLASSPAASITDTDVAAAIEILLADTRVRKAIHVGRENGAADGRQMIDFEIPGFSGVHTLGRVISAFGEAERLAQQFADKERAAAHKKAAREKKILASLVVPTPGKDAAFDEWLYDVEVDTTGVEGEMSDTPQKRARLYLDFLDAQKTANRKKGAAAAVKTKAKNEAKGIDQKGLTGSTKQKRWASEIRAQMLPGFSDENRRYLEENGSSCSFWIENRNLSGSRLSAMMDEMRAKTQAVLVQPTNSVDSHQKAAAARNAWHRFMNGEKA